MDGSLRLFGCKVKCTALPISEAPLSTRNQKNERFNSGASTTRKIERMIDDCEPAAETRGSDNRAQHRIRGKLAKAEPGKRRLTESYPWVVAFAFGLLHGFGFAGALKEIGLPQTDIPLALFTFNLGVEAGQLMFVGGRPSQFQGCQSRLQGPPPTWRMVAAYGIGTISTVWLVSRVSSFS